MDSATYAAEAKIEATHWWFTQRRRLFASLISKYGVSKTARVVDIGTGTGANLRLLKEMGFADVTGIDPSADAAHWCEAKGLGPVRQGDIRSIPLEDESVDFVTATDVVEHVPEDAVALAEIHRVVRPGGQVLFTVPAFQSLWGLQDEQSHHYRRYRLKPFLKLLGDAGFTARESFYFNFLLFVPVFAARQLIKLANIKLNSENEMNNPALNAILTQIFRLDVATAPRLRPPFGVSILVFAERC